MNVSCCVVSCKILFYEFLKNHDIAQNIQMPVMALTYRKGSYYLFLFSSHSTERFENELATKDRDED